MVDHLIADSGIQFITREIEINPSEPLMLSSGKTLKYSFVETVDFIEGTKLFMLLYYHPEANKYIPLDELLKSTDAVVRRPNGREEIDESGMVQMDTLANTTLFSTFEESDPEVFSMNSLISYRVVDPENGHMRVAAFDLLVNKWLPMPMYRKEVDGITSNAPMGWCRMNMEPLGDGQTKGSKRYRLIWAFDTQMGEDEFSLLRPFVGEEDGGVCQYGLCNKVDLLMDFLSSDEEFHAFSDYIASLLGINLEADDSRKYKAFYIYFLNYIRLSGGAPDVMLHNNTHKQIDVDLVLDIGNSRTCGILFEEGEFTRGKMLELRDLSHPETVYENRTFDMRVVFRKADFGNDIVLREEMFQWCSFVRIGEEARRLVYRSLEEEGISEKTTHYSSPKRYLWDTRPYEGQWENLVTQDDVCNVRLSSYVSVPGLSKYFEKDGTYNPRRAENAELELLTFDDSASRYSRASLMTFAFVEIFQHALAQINSIRYREQWGNVDVRRTIRNVIITCPTAMPLREQVYLRRSACDAYEALTLCHNRLPMATITPSPEALAVTDPYAPAGTRTWKYDEASCCQLVYLYAEAVQRYSGEVSRFFRMKGHVRPELKEQGYDKESLTIGTIDIGAGTTDIMICTYQYDSDGTTKLTPTPLFWDSFYLAGDDILRNLVQNIVIEGHDHGDPLQGNISAALTARILAMTDDELRALPCLDNVVYRTKVAEMCGSISDEAKRERKQAFASILIHDFFGNDSSMMSYRDRRCRNDFNTQISVPIAQRMMDLLRNHRPSRLYTYDELFPDVKPAEYLLSYFEHHFGFRFEELSWRFNPDEVASIVKSTMEPLMKQMALVFYTQQCDIIVFGGRPTSLDAITELFIKYVPTSPDRLIRLNEYRVGTWFPMADGQGYFYDQKAIVAVGGMVGYLASHAGLKGMVIDFTQMIDKMNSTANYFGVYNSRRQQVQETLLSPTSASATLTSAVFPIFLGCRQLDAVIYQARPFYAIYNHGNSGTFQIRISRDYHEDKEVLYIEEATDEEYRNRMSDIELVPQSLVDDGKYWLDKGEFELTIK